MTESQSASAAPLSPAAANLRSTLAHVGNIVGFLPALLILLGIVVGDVATTAPNTVGLPFVLLELLIGLAAFAVWVLLVVLSLVAAVRVTSGAPHHYPLSLHLIK